MIELNLCIIIFDKIYVAMKFYLKIWCFAIISTNCFSQNIPQDYIITIENDTIYGYLHEEGFKEFYPKDAPYLKYRFHYKKDIKSYSHNGKVYEYFKKEYTDGIYDKTDYLKVKEDPGYYYEYIDNYYRKEPKKSDFVITKSKDTIYGTISKSLLSEKLSIKNNNNKKIKITRKEVLAYQYENKFMQSLPNYKRKGGYFELLIDGKIKLYGVEEKYHTLDREGRQIETIHYDYYLFDGGEMKKVKNLRKSICKELFNNEKLICDKIRNKELAKENLPLIIEYYNNLHNQTK